MITLSVVINTKNSADTIKKTLESVKWADEIIVVDMHSKDSTVQIAEKYTKRIFRFKDVGYVEPARNYAISKAKGMWILVVDADEEVPFELKELILRIIEGNVEEHMRGDVFAIPRKNIVFGDWLQHAGWWPDFQLRLFKESSVEWSDKIHSTPKITGKLIELPAHDQFAILHHNYPTIESFISRLNRYTTKEVEGRKKTDINAATIVSGFRNELMARLFKYKGIEGETREVGIAFLQAMYELIVRMKQWERQGNIDQHPSHKETIREIQGMQQDLAYWVADWHVNHTQGMEKLIWMVRRKLKI